MPKAEAEDLKKVTLNLFKRDYSRLQDLYPVKGAAAAIRELVRQHIQKVDQRIAGKDLGKMEVELDV